MTARAAATSTTTVVADPAPLFGRRSILSRFDFDAHNGYGTGTIAGTTYCWDVRVQADGDDLTLGFGNFIWGGDDSRTGTTTSIYLRVVVHDPVTGGLYPVSAGGKFQFEVGPLVYCLTDPIGIRLTAGTRLRVRVYVTTAADGDKVPATQAYYSGTQDGFQAGDQTLAASPTFAQIDGWGYGPLGAFATSVDDPDAPHVFICSDSIGAGQNDGGAGSTADRLGFILRAFQESVGYLQGSAAGAAALSWADMHRSGGMKFPFASASTHGIISLGTNDGGTPDTAALIETHLLTCAKQMKRRGITHVYACTISPQSTSTDSWTTTANQTATSWSAGRRISVNNWLRGGSPIDPTTLLPVAVGTTGAVVAGDATHPFDGYFEIADTVESARDSGIWKVHTGAVAISEGTHPNRYGADLMARGIDMTKFGQATSIIIPGDPNSPDVTLGADLYQWLKPESLGADGTSIASWTDSSGNTRPLAQSTGSLKPVVVANALNTFSAARFDGVDDLLVNAGLNNLTTPYELFIVGRFRSLTGALDKYMWSGFGFGLYQALASHQLVMTGGSGIGSASDTASFHSYSAVFTASSSAALYQDGNLIVQGNAGATTTTNGISLGASVLGDHPADVDIVEVIVSKRLLSTNDRQSIESWLRFRYGTA